MAGDRLLGSGGYNRFVGGYQTEDDQLNIETLASTKMACEKTILNQETKSLMTIQGEGLD
ncbi:MAG: META domain-containing protein [Leptolyngbya sp. IPPAS B-1204]|nr:META domain-containing protein [Elainella sp. C42_A2020_010]